MIHDQLDIAHWKAHFPLEELRAELKDLPITLQPGGMNITSPFHIAMVEQIREEALAGKPLPRRVPTDSFIWNEGEPRRREITKVGGLPYRARDKKWPMAEAGRPMTFVGQFCFADSTDLTGPLPGDILLIFADSLDEYGFNWAEEIENAGMLFEWVSIGDFPLITAEEIPFSPWFIAPCYGTLYRTFDYLDCDEYFEEYNQGYELPILEATKIGGVPYWVQEEEEMPGRFLCASATLAPQGDCHKNPQFNAFPFLNRAGARNYEEARHSAELGWGDMGVLNLFVDKKGQVHWNIQSG